MHTLTEYISRQEIEVRLIELGKQLTLDYKDSPLKVLILLKGGFMFAADLVRHINLPLQIECLSVSSYEGTNSTGVVSIKDFNTKDLNQFHVLLIDDILDTGLTLSSVKQKIQLEQQPLSVKTCVLLDKQIKNKRTIEADYKAFSIENKFVVGYGLDYNEEYRNLPHISILGQ